MKRLVIAVFLLSATLSICFYGTYTVKKECTKMIEILNEASELNLNKINYKKAENLNFKIKAQWKHSHNALSKLVMHSSLEPVEEDISRLESCITNKDMPEYKKLCADAAEHLRHLMESEKISPENIF